MLEPVLCGLLSQAPLLPKLRGHFAEFLNNASSVGLRILSSSTCVGLRYGYVMNDSGFSRRMAFTLPYYFSVVSRACLSAGGFSCRPGLPFSPGSFPGSASHTCPHSSVITQYRNFHLLSIGYGSRPHLRPRLTQRRSATLETLDIRPEGFSPSSRYSFRHSLFLTLHAPFRARFPVLTMLPYHPHTVRVLSFGVVFQPRTFSARDLSTSELLRTLSMYGCF